MYVISLICNESILLFTHKSTYTIDFFCSVYHRRNYLSLWKLQEGYWVTISGTEWCCLRPHHEWMDPRWQVHSERSKLAELSSISCLMSEVFLWEMQDDFWDRERTVVTVHLGLEGARENHPPKMNRQSDFSVVSMVCPCFIYLRSSVAIVGRTGWK